MGTNFYMFTQNKKNKKCFGEKLRIVDEPDFGYEIHIAKTSMGWQPAFEAHENIRSVLELKEIYDRGDVRIYDEYGAEYDWPAFEERVVNFGNERNYRTARNNEWRDYGTDLHEFTSIDGYRFQDVEFS